MAQRDENNRQQQQGSTGQRSEGEGGGHRQADLPGEHGGQQGGKAGLGKGQREQQDVRRPPGAEDKSGGEQQLQQEPSGASRPTQGNLGTTQREWSQRADIADSGEE